MSVADLRHVVIACPPQTFYYLEFVSVLIFTAEYFCRIWSVGEENAYAGVLGRLRFAVTFYALVDLATIVPFYVDLGIAGVTPQGALQSSTFIRALRLLRLLKADQYVDSFSKYGSVIAEK